MLYSQQVHNEVRRCWYRHRASRFNTRSILLSSWRKNSRASRDTVTRDTRVTEGMTHANCTDMCKLNRTCQEHVSWSSKKRDIWNEKPNSASWQNEDIDGILLETKTTNSVAPL